jgi:rod shape determining protein RodA
VKKFFYHFKKLDWILILSAIFLVLFGLLSIFSSSKGNFLNLKKQAIFFGIGFFLMLIFSFFDWRWFKETRLIFFLYFLSIFLLMGLFFFAPKIRGTRSWYKIGQFSFDPTEFLKIVLILLLAKYFSKTHVEMYRLRHILISGFYVFLPSVLIYLQPDLGSVLILIILWLGILIISGINLRQFFLLVFVFLLIFILGWQFFLKDYQKKRIISFFTPIEPLGISWSQNQSKIAISTGGIFGQGIKKGSQTQLGFLPEPQTDFIFAAISEEMGLIGISILFFLFSILIWRIVRISILSDNNFSRLFASGFAVLLVCQIFINIGMNLGLLPIIGIPLPFVSYGGSSLISNFLALGILESIQKRD